MPGPIAFRGLPSVHQRRFSSLDTEKVGVTMGPPPSSPMCPSSSGLSSSSSSSSSSMDHVPLSVVQKHSRQDIHRLVKEAMQIGVEPHIATLFPPEEGSSSNKNAASSKKSGLDARVRDTTGSHSLLDPKSDNICNGQLICIEVAGTGSQWKYTMENHSENTNRGGFHVVNMRRDRNPLDDLVSFVRSCVVPEGYPESVSPSYTPYMRWRALKYLFGGAMSVFTTRSLLHAVGVSRQGAGSSAMAINWVIKDGAGRVGKLLFARHGKKFDYDMKQLRFTGDLLMEFGAAVELATAAAPQLFLPLACAANIAKNVAAVASTSTRAPIYKSFARGENIGDVTAKGECISNIADLVGTGMGILISRNNPSLMATFAVLSCGYLCCSYQEIKSVMLPTLNRARFKVAVQSFLDTGRVPTLYECNRKESIFTPPWAREKPFVLGARVTEAFQTPHKFVDLVPWFEKENYVVTYNSKKRRAYVVLKEKANSDDVLRATFHAQVLECILQESSSSKKGYDNLHCDSFHDCQNNYMPGKGVEAAIKESCKLVGRMYETFACQASSLGWVMGESLLNPGNARLCSWTGS